MALKTILFDLDGTLTDSGEGIINCAYLALEHFGMPLPTREEMRVFVGPPLHDTFMKFGVPKESVEEAVKIYRSRYIPTGMFENTPYPGVKDMLETLKSQGHRLLIATSKPEWMAVDILKHFSLDGYFDRICGASMDTSRSTKEDVIAYLLELNGTAEAMLMVGDTAFDVIGAAAHKIPTIGVSWGYGTVADMQKAGAVDIAHNMQQLLQLINKTR
ncbi:MAG: HAD hydrolase-like protein [Oscillospiraceae bacterium]|nr:HAD hydrolase-like protein [Oscillospiraceae bacterium]